MVRLIDFSELSDFSGWPETTISLLAILPKTLHSR